MSTGAPLPWHAQTPSAVATDHMRIVIEACLVESDHDRLSFQVTEFFVSDDDQFLVLGEDRGWTMIQDEGNDATLRDVIRGADNSTLPDDAEETGDTRTWSRYRAALAQRHGLDVPETVLRTCAVEWRVRLFDSDIADWSNGVA